MPSVLQIRSPPNQCLSWDEGTQIKCRIYTHSEVSSAQVQTRVHVLRLTLQTVLVGLDVGREDFLMVNSFLLHASDHRFGAEVGEERVVELDVAYIRRTRKHWWSVNHDNHRGRQERRHTAAKRVKLCNLFLICDRDIGEVLICAPD